MDWEELGAVLRGDPQSSEVTEPGCIHAVVVVVEPGIGGPHSVKEAPHSLVGPERERRSVAERLQERPGDVGAFLD